MAAAKVKGKKGKRPARNLDGVRVSKGLKKAPASKAEVSGRTSPGAFYWCWACGASNWVPFGYNYFYCWRCVVLNRC